MVVALHLSKLRAIPIAERGETRKQLAFLSRQQRVERPGDLMRPG